MSDSSFRIHETERRRDTERLVRVEARLDFMDEKLNMHGETLDEVASGVNVIQLQLATQGGGKKMLNILAHGGTALVASIATVIGTIITWKTYFVGHAEAASKHLGGP